jgi:hypothetical protein
MNVVVGTMTSIVDDHMKEIRKFAFADQNDPRRKGLQQRRRHERGEVRFAHVAKQRQSLNDPPIGTAHEVNPLHHCKQCLINVN